MIDSLVLWKVPKHVRFQLISRPQDIKICRIVTDFHHAMSIENLSQQSRFSVKELVSNVEERSWHFFLSQRRHDNVFLVFTVGFFGYARRKFTAAFGKLTFSHWIAAIQGRRRRHWRRWFKRSLLSFFFNEVEGFRVNLSIPIYVLRQWNGSNVRFLTSNFWQLGTRRWCWRCFRVQIRMIEVMSCRSSRSCKNARSKHQHGIFIAKRTVGNPLIWLHLLSWFVGLFGTENEDKIEILERK